ncbi:hypothetical protein N6L27_05345 [Leisingera sp. SS27]|uniref:hypothetical protein n=1 Tax=Leisingera sp. SS27 TaxID=2979462 RepID=UPI00232D83B7|nr:hypothetical protein [Leisingera sp. SS27]MDC0657414.1 hypothetical protein [Leisingera sp. SS27]
MARNEKVTSEVAEEWVFPKLKKIGQQAEFRGGFKLSDGGLNYRKMSWVVADYGQKHGINLLRSSSEPLSQLLMPLPPGEFLAITDKFSYRNDKNLPSVAMSGASKLAGFLNCFAEMEFRQGATFWMITVPAVGSRTSIDGLFASVDEGFRRLRNLEEELGQAAGGAVEPVIWKMETPYRADDRTFFLHFHGLLKVEAGAMAEGKMMDALLRHAKRFGYQRASIELKRVARSSFSAAAHYCVKPSHAAFQIASADHSEVFVAFMIGGKKKRLLRCKGRFQEFRKQADSKRQKPRRIIHKGQIVYRLLSMEEGGGKGTGRAEGAEVVSGQLRAGPHDICSDVPKLDREREGGVTTQANVFCGISDVVPIPGDKLAAWAIVKGFKPLGETGCMEGQPVSVLNVAQSEAVVAWERNTGRRFDILELLEPFAQQLSEAMLGRSNVQYCTITCSEGVRAAISKILAGKEAVKSQDSVLASAAKHT